MKLLKSIGAVLAGFMAVVILSIVTDFIVESLKFFPPANQSTAYVWWMLLIALIYRTLYTVVGGYVTALLAPNKPIRHTVILGIVGIIAGTLGTVANWNMGNQWYPIMLVVLALPSTWLGGWLFAQK